MTNICPTCMCFNKMNGVLKALVVTLMFIIFGILSYILLPHIMPGDSAFVFLMFVPFLIGGLLFGLGLFGFAFGISKLCERIKGK
ncbi:hypothetical protein [Terrihalobacillus insolitus]|uniref:hypothetical protein n=1 Tax=Terrihalobacillus insolitus TaxID=2950438 RepID=UPI0023424B84|nr:hypothetical protein [Terrihalobacillus insolitus]MDC3414743.1 hypothetical protein [Terrihalobacillus insolitus]